MIPRPELIDAMAEARLEQLHLTDHDVGRPAPWDVEAATAAASLAAGLSLRIRFGRSLLAVGAAIAGENDNERVHRAA
jgi:hypothetical protein